MKSASNTENAEVVDPVLHNDSSTSHETSLEEAPKMKVWTAEETERRWARAERIFANAEPPEILERPFQTVDGEWLTIEEVIEYARNLEKSAGDS